MTYGDQWAGDSIDQNQDVLWPPGNYEGTLLRYECGASAAKGTNYIRLWFEVGGAEKAVDVWITEASMQMATERLAKVGWDGQYPECGFAAMGKTVSLYMRHDTYRGRTRERWDISTMESRPANDDVMSRFAARFRATQAAPAAVPGTPPKAPPKPPAVPVPAAPARPVAAPPRTAKKAEAVHTQDTAWAAWVQVFGEKCDAESFWRAVDDVRGHTPVESMTAEQWDRVAGACLPF